LLQEKPTSAFAVLLTNPAIVLFSKVALFVDIFPLNVFDVAALDDKIIEWRGNAEDIS